MIGEVEAPLHSATAENVDHFDVVALIVLGFEYLDPQVSSGGL